MNKEEYENIHNDRNKTSISSINFEDIFEEREQGKINFGGSIGECKIQVYGSEGNIPHFHIENKDLSWICCIRITVPEYFSHGVKDKKLNKSQINELIKVLNSKAKKLNFSVYEAICLAWNLDDNNTIKVNPKRKMPDYTKLNNGGNRYDFSKRSI